MVWWMACLLSWQVGCICLYTCYNTAMITSRHHRTALSSLIHHLFNLHSIKVMWYRTMFGCRSCSFIMSSSVMTPSTHVDLSLLLLPKDGFSVFTWRIQWILLNYTFLKCKTDLQLFLLIRGVFHLLLWLSCKSTKYQPLILMPSADTKYYLQYMYYTKTTCQCNSPWGHENILG